MSFGLTLAGFNPMRVEDVRQALIDDFRTAFGQNVQVDDESVLGQVIGVMSERMADLWELGEEIYASAYPGGASGAALDDLLALASATRLPATFSQATLRLSGTPGTVIPSGSITRDDSTHTDWVHQASATIGGGGTVNVLAQPAASGPIVGLAGTITDIRTPITGWASVTNLTDAMPGRNAQTDAQLRSYFHLLMIAGSSSAEALRAALLRLTGVTECAVLENDGDYYDGDGRPPHSFEAVVRGGADQAIIDTIWFGKANASQTFGTTTGTALDSRGNAHTISFSRPISRNVWITVDYSVQPGFAADGEAQILAALLDYGNGFNIGKDIIPFEFIQRIEVPQLQSLALRVGLSASPATSNPIVLSDRELASFDSTRIVFNRI